MRTKGTFTKILLRYNFGMNVEYNEIEMEEGSTFNRETKTLSCRSDGFAAETSSSPALGFILCRKAKPAYILNICCLSPQPTIITRGKHMMHGELAKHTFQHELFSFLLLSFGLLVSCLLVLNSQECQISLLVSAFSLPLIVG